MKKPFTLYKRFTTKKNKYIYYVQFRDSNGKRLTAVSSGEVSKSKAEAWAINQLVKGLVRTTEDPKFSVFAQDWFTSECKYLKRQFNRRDYSRSYAEYQRAILKNHILPYFADNKLSQITVDVIEDWLLSFKEAYSSATANRALSVLRIMLREAYRREIIHKDPTPLVQRLQERAKEKGILTISEARLLFQPDSLVTVWNNDLFHYCFNLLACTTGMRMGEIQALRLEDFHKDYLTISHSWDRKYGLKNPKSNSFRAVPIPQFVSALLKELISGNGVSESDDFIFHGESKNTAIDHKVIPKYLYRALTKIGIIEEERKARNITFHSWRHFFNTYMRGKVPDSILQKVTGHRTLRMTEHYDHQQLEDLEDIRKIHEKMLT